MNKIKQIKTNMKPIADIHSIEDIAKYLDKDKSYQVLAYTIPAIMFGEYHNGFNLGLETLTFDQIDSIRIFSCDSELYCYRFADPATGQASSSLRGRLRTDNPIDNSTGTYCHDASQILIGSKVIQETESHFLVSEDRGFQLLLPRKWAALDLSESRFRVYTRNYLSEWDNGQLTYCDHRFMMIGNQTKEL